MGRCSCLWAGWELGISYALSSACSIWPSSWSRLCSFFWTEGGGSSSLLYRISLVTAKRIFGYLYEAWHHRQSPWKVKRPSGGHIVEQRSLYGASESTLVLMIQGTHGTYGRLDVHFGEETPVRIAGVLRFRDESMKLKLEGCAEYLQQWSVSRLRFGCVYVRF